MPQVVIPLRKSDDMAIASAQQLAVANLYTALFNRAPDAAGLAFWAQALGNGVPLATITQSFLGSSEAKASYPAAQTAEQFVASFYQSVFGRALDSSGLVFWTTALNANGGASSDVAKALLVSQIVGVASTPLPSKPADLTDAQYAQTVADRALFGNKITVGVYYAVELGGTNLDIARQALAVVGSTAVSVDAGKLIASGASGASASAPVIVTPNLVATTATDTLTGTAGSDTFTATHLTLGALDSIDGGAGIDTLNYLDASTTAAAIPAVLVQNVEVINVRNVNTAGFSAEVTTMTAGNITRGQTLTIAGLTITASGGGPPTSAANVAAALRTGVTVSNAVVSGTLTAGYTTSGTGTQVIFTSTSLGNMPDLVVTGTTSSRPSPTITQGINGAPDSVNSANFLGATNFNSDRSTVAVSFTGLTAAQAIGVIGDNAVANGNLTGTYAAGVTGATLNLTGGTKGGIVTLDAVSGSALASLTITSTGLANVMGSLVLTPSVTTLAIVAGTNLQIDGISTTGLRTITVSGAAGAVALGMVSSTVLSSIDASGLTGGSVSVTIASPTATITGTAGNDTVNVAAGVVVTSAINAGAGSADTIVFSTGASLTSATAALITNFEVLQLSAASGVQTYDTTLIAGITSIKVAQSNGAVALTRLGAAATVTVSGDVSGDGLSLGLADASGNADEVSVTLDNGKTATSELGIAVNLSKLKTVNVETINLHSLGVVANGTPGNSVVNDVANTTLSKVVIDGTQATIFNTGTLASAVELRIDASASTGFLTVSGTNATKALTVNAGVSGSSIQGGAGGDAITLAAAGNGVDTISYFGAAVSRQDFVNAAGSALAKQDEIVNFQSGTDKIGAFILFAPSQKVLVNKTFATTADLVTAEASADFFKDAGNVVRGVVAANIGADTYLIVDASREGLFNTATDLVIKLTGVTALAQGDLIFY